MGWESIYDGVGGHEGAGRTRPGFRWFRPALGGGALVAALLALFGALLLGASQADARVSVDPCATGAPWPPGESRVCNEISLLPPYEIGFAKDQEPLGTGSETCNGRTQKVAGTDANRLWTTIPNLGYSPLIAHWDYWTYRGEWVTWSDGTWLRSGEGEGEDAYRGYAIAYKPVGKNWAPWPWAARAWFYCDQRPQKARHLPGEGRAQDVTPGQRSQGSLSSRTHADETVESGDSGDDVIKGEGEDDALVGEGGDDELHGAGGDDKFVGGFGDDSVRGGGGDDYYLGGGGEDTARGGGGDDQLLGGPHGDTAFGGGGSDELFDDEGNDELHGGRGDDRFSARDSSVDTIRCGDGEDIVLSDRRDRVSADCEHVYRTEDEVPKRPPKI